MAPDRGVHRRGRRGHRRAGRARDGAVTAQPRASRVLRLRRPSRLALASLLADQRSAEFSYPEVGATRGELPPGYRHDRWSADLGPFTPEAFQRARAALFAWIPQYGAAMSIFPGDPVADGAAFVLVFSLPFGGLVSAAGRVVYVIDEPARSGFAYGTLPAHPERGEEAFLVVRQGDRLRYEIIAFSRPAHPLARLGAPVTRWLQLRATRRYIHAMSRAAGGLPSAARATRPR